MSVSRPITTRPAVCTRKAPRRVPLRGMARPSPCRLVSCMSADVRTQTEYGTLRSYFAFGLNALNSPGGALVKLLVRLLAVAMERAFIQFAGFTLGRSDTFFAFYNGAAYGLVPFGFDGSSGPSGLNVAAYTWQFGNGLSATFSVEDAIAHSLGGIISTRLTTAALLPAPSAAISSSRISAVATKRA